MGWIVFLFFLSAIFMISRLFDNGHGAVVLVPIYAIIAVITLYTLIKRTARFDQPMRSAIRIGALVALVYLGNKVYIGTLPWYELAPPGKTQMADGNATWILAALAGWGGLAGIAIVTYILGKRHRAIAEDLFIASATAHIGRPPDTKMISWGRGAKSGLLLWVAEGRICITDTRATFSPDQIRSIREVRDWHIEGTKVEAAGAMRDVYTLNIGFKDISNPLAQFYCGPNRQAAYQISEALSQMVEKISAE